MRVFDRLLAIAGDTEPETVALKIRVFRTLLLLHASIQSWHLYVVFSSLPIIAPFEAFLVAAAIVHSAGFGLTFATRYAHWAPWIALPFLFGQAWFLFPSTTNHFYLSTWLMTILAVAEGREEDDRALALEALQWSVAIVLFFTGFQKVLHGTYFHGDFLAFVIGTQQNFADAFSSIVPADEIERLSAIDPYEHGAGPYRSSAPLLLVVSNTVYLIEMLAPVALVARRTRTTAAAATLVFVVALQLGAREILFALLMTIALSLFFEHRWVARGFWLIVVLYLYAFAMSLELVPGHELLRDSMTPLRPHL